MEWSFSRLNSYIQCPWQFYLTYIECKPREGGFFGEYGSWGHEILEKYAKNEIEIYEMADLYQTNYYQNVITPAPPNKWVNLDERYFEEGKEYFENFSGFGEYEIIGVEEPFNISIGDIKITGIIDLILKDKQKNIHLADHKSSDVKKVDSDKAKEYWKQMYLYSIAIKDKYGKYPKQLHINAFRKNQWFQIPFDKKEVTKVKKWVQDTVKQIKKDKVWEAKPSNYFCFNLCGVRSSCDYKK